MQREQKGTLSALFMLADSLEAAAAPPGAAKLLRGTILNRAGSIRHDDRDRANEELLAPDLAIFLILCGAADWWKATGKSSEKLSGFMTGRNAAALEDGFCNGPFGGAAVKNMREFIGRWGNG